MALKKLNKKQNQSLNNTEFGENEVKTSKLANWFRTSQVVVAIENGINDALHYLSYLLWPFIKLKKLTYDRLRHDQQKVVISILFLLPVIIGFCLFFAYPSK